MHPGKTLLHANAVIKETSDIDTSMEVSEQVEEVENGQVVIHHHDDHANSAVTVEGDEGVVQQSTEEMQLNIEIKNNSDT